MLVLLVCSSRAARSVVVGIGREEERQLHCTRGVSHPHPHPDLHPDPQSHSTVDADACALRAGERLRLALATSLNEDGQEDGNWDPQEWRAGAARAKSSRLETFEYVMYGKVYHMEGDESTHEGQLYAIPFSSLQYTVPVYCTQCTVLYILLHTRLLCVPVPLEHLSSTSLLCSTSLLPSPAGPAPAVAFPWAHPRARKGHVRLLGSSESSSHAHSPAPGSRHAALPPAPAPALTRAPRAPREHATCLCGPELHLGTWTLRAACGPPAAPCKCIFWPAELVAEPLSHSFSPLPLPSAHSSSSSVTLPPSPSALPVSKSPSPLSSRLFSFLAARRSPFAAYSPLVRTSSCLS